MMTLSDIYRYPVKGLSPEPLDRVALTAKEALPFDRMYAIENGPGRFDPSAPRHLPKVNFLMLMRQGRLAALKSTFEQASHRLTIHRDGRQVASGRLDTAIGRQTIEQFMAAYLKDELRGPPKIVFAEGHSFSDVALKCVHIVNRASVDEVSRAALQPIDALRFRPNLVIAGAAPWAEFQWIGATVTIGAVKLRVVERTVRCAATEVDPGTGTRDLALPALLERTWGHSDFGVYADVIEGGPMERGADVVVSMPA